MHTKEFVRGRVSIVTPVYNGEAYLARYFKSILAQTYRELEVILVDDGSTDNTLQVAETYRLRLEDCGVQIRIVSSPHRNASAALCQGLPLVTGEYLCWPDSDDVLSANSIEKRVSFLERHPEYHCVRSLAWYFDPETGERLPADEKQGDLKKEDLFWDVLESRTYVCCGCYMLRSEDFFHIYPEGKIPVYNVGQNFQMLLPFLYIHKCPTLEVPLYGVAVRKGSHSRRVLTREQTEEKYEEYEHLADELAAICRIRDRKSLQRIRRWKLCRRFNLAMMYQDYWKAWKAGMKLLILGDVRILACARGFAVKCMRHVRDAEWNWYKYRKRRKLKGEPSIIASNCVGTMMYHDMKLPWRSPTVNLMIPMEDFVKFAGNLRWYMDQELCFVKDPAYRYPMGYLGDIRIHFVHYQSEEEAQKKWEIRKKRINWDRLYFIGSEKDGCTYEILRQFEQLPYKNKVIFTRKDYPEFTSAFTIRGFESRRELGNVLLFQDRLLKRRYMDDFDYVAFLNQRESKEDDERKHGKRRCWKK